MSDSDKLEQRIGTGDTSLESALEDKVGVSPLVPESTLYSVSALRNYVVDTTAALGFYTPLMASAEYFVAGMEPEKVLKSRLMAAAYHAIMMRPYGKFRQWWADYWHADHTSHPLKKFAVDTSATILFQVPAYSTILYLAGASLKEVLVALPVGLTIGALSGRPFGYVLDKWRKLCGTKPTLDK